jgi:hypothetical protein
MIWIRRAFFITLFLGLALVLHWSLPSYDTVRILENEVMRMQVETSNDQGQEVTRTRDVRLINAVTEGGGTRVYRNEDTGFGFPPYFKFDSADLAAEAANLVSNPDNPKYSVITSYGWRIPFMSLFPNAVSVRAADGPDDTSFPWVKWIAIGLLLVGVLFIRNWVINLFRRGPAGSA